MKPLDDDLTAGYKMNRRGWKGVIQFATLLVHRQNVMNKPCGLLITMLLVVLWDDSGASIPVCITNCVQCKQMFGPYFQGRACGDACISSNGRVTPDCNNPASLGKFLKRLY